MEGRRLLRAPLRNSDRKEEDGFRLALSSYLINGPVSAGNFVQHQWRFQEFVRLSVCRLALLGHVNPGKFVEVPCLRPMYF